MELYENPDIQACSLAEEDERVEYLDVVTQNLRIWKLLRADKAERLACYYTGGVVI